AHDPLSYLPTEVTFEDWKVEAARKLRKAVDGLTRVLAIEILTAARGIDLRAPQTPSPATAAVIERLRKDVAGPGPDRFLSPEIEQTVQLVANGELLAAVESVTGHLA
ncbi:MAG: aromatic amino acid lyase, partial [Rothia sp. (in: high G+C Gram-positive bacteria)]|nr:aromatic amino acid lyase [Rothia sp. (in: high G+C Gram-positive bacteria)]